MGELANPIPGSLDCHVELIEEENGSLAFSLEICGTIYAPGGCNDAVLNVLIADTTDGTDKAKRVYTNAEKWQIKNSKVFCYTAKLGKLPNEVTTLTDWMAVAKIPADCLVFPLQGKRNVLFITSILSGHSGTELASAACPFTYENFSLGYIELEENTRQAKNMAISLAFAVAAADRKISVREAEVINNWAKNNIAVDKIAGTFNKLLAKTIAFFPNCNQIYSDKICKKIANTVPLKIRCNILEFCLRVAAANETVAPAQMVLLKHMAGWFGIHREKFRAMAENILLAGMYEVEDLEISVGITSDMNKDQICRQLSKEYRKWNARVTSRNREIETQSERMLKFIAQMRNQYTQ